ncbi:MULTISPECIES: FtsQ-type POTRA domain-containing protein [unclassified Streptomyces]|uniref:cell division protein FtsQ/DivIB n=1 Tax=Streptomycetaceae TaxID=2062 RepID=UPI002E7A9DD9|nr:MULTISPECIES: FtsQ-type POTRA domain-containing protein [unclassified Streptomyces]MED7954086.1 FtsQ-type POTRA domain-containing protein [Streptomyces sp. BE303]MEE1825961.1 FtsQ-type POTRA domain-containing protein [Streptomyces sp. BE20]
MADARLAEPPPAGGRGYPHDEDLGDEEYTPRLRLSRRGVVVLGSLAAAVLGVLAWLVFLSSVLDVRSISVQGVQDDRLTADQVRSAIGGVGSGPLARVDLADVRRRVEAIPRVAGAEVWRGWPHTLRVKITQRSAVAAVKGEDGRFTQVDAGGVSFATEPAAPEGVPVVELRLSQPARDVESVIGRAQLVQGAVAVAAGLPAEVRQRAGAVLVHSYDDIQLQLSGGATVRWGSPEQTDRKARVLVALLGQKGTNFDVSAPEAPAVSG